MVGALAGSSHFLLAVCLGNDEVPALKKKKYLDFPHIYFWPLFFSERKGVNMKYI